MNLIVFPDGTTITSTALTQAAIDQAMQLLSCAALGLVAVPAPLTLAVMSGQFVAGYAVSTNVYTGLSVSGSGIPLGTVITGIIGDQVVLSNAATATGSIQATVVDSNAYAKVRVGYSPKGQPGWGPDEDVVFVRCVTKDDDYTRMRDLTGLGQDAIYTITDVFSRCWQVFWTVYGPNAIDNARALKSAFTTVPYFEYQLAQSLLYLQPSTSEPIRAPENKDGQWWNRVDWRADFFEQITEQITNQTVASVEVLARTGSGPAFDITVQ